MADEFRAPLDPIVAATWDSGALRRSVLFQRYAGRSAGIDDM